MDEARARDIVRVGAVVVGLSGLMGVIDDLTALVSGRSPPPLDQLLLLTNLLALMAGAGALARRPWARGAAVGWAVLLTFYAIAAIVAILAPARAWWPGAVVLVVAAVLATSWSWLLWRTHPTPA
jgi:hypothetical protein